MSKPLLSPAIRFLPAESPVTLEVAHQSSEVVEAACLSETALYRTLCSSAPPPRSTPRMPGWGTPHRDGSFVLLVPVAVAGCPRPAVSGGSWPARIVAGVRRCWRGRESLRPGEWSGGWAHVESGSRRLWSRRPLPQGLRPLLPIRRGVGAARHSPARHRALPRLPIPSSEPIPPLAPHRIRCCKPTARGSGSGDLPPAPQELTPPATSHSVIPECSPSVRGVRRGMPG